MKTILLLFSLLIATSVFSQNDEAYVTELTKEFTTKLQERGITQFFSTKHYCSGTIEMFMIDGKMCTSKETYYQVFIFWQEDGRSLMKKIDNCGLFYSVPLSNDELFSFVAKNQSSLKQEEVKKYKSEVFTGEPELRTSVQPCFRSFSFTMGEESFGKSFNLFDISNDSEGKNLNYDYNQSLALVQLNGKMEALILAASFKRQ